MASGIKLAYEPKMQVVIVEDTTDTVAIALLPKFQLVIITPTGAPPAVGRSSAWLF